MPFPNIDTNRSVCAFIPIFGNDSYTVHTNSQSPDRKIKLKSDGSKVPYLSQFGRKSIEQLPDRIQQTEPIPIQHLSNKRYHRIRKSTWQIDQNGAESKQAKELTCAGILPRAVKRNPSGPPEKA